MSRFRGGGLSPVESSAFSEPESLRFPAPAFTSILTFISLSVSVSRPHKQAVTSPKGHPLARLCMESPRLCGDGAGQDTAGTRFGVLASRPLPDQEAHSSVPRLHAVPSPDQGVLICSGHLAGCSA